MKIAMRSILALLATALISRPTLLHLPAPVAWS